MAPLVYGEMKSSSHPRRLLFYNHYDVQPEEPLELWKSPPFKPEIRDGVIYGRGVSDDKGELVSRLKIVESYLKTDGELPCNVKFCFEGEEETGSVHLGDYVSKFSDLFKADAVVWEYGTVDTKGTPMVTLGVKGMIYLEFVLRSLSAGRPQQLRRRPPQRALEDGQAPEPAQGRERNDQGPRMVRRGDEPGRGRAGCPAGDALRRGGVQEDLRGEAVPRRDGGRRRRRRPWSSGPPGTSQASGQDTRGPVRRQSSPRRYTSRWTSGWCQSRTQQDLMDEAQEVPRRQRLRGRGDATRKHGACGKNLVQGPLRPGSHQGSGESVWEEADRRAWIPGDGAPRR